MWGISVALLCAVASHAAGLTESLADSFNEILRDCLTPPVPPGLASDLSKPHSDLHLLLVDTSQYLQNYRHVTNSAAIYRAVQWLGVPDSKIHLMMGECSACDPRNVKAALLFPETSHDGDLYEGPIQTSYRGKAVTTEAWKLLVSGRSHRFSPNSRRMKTSEDSNLLIYLNGHGGNQFTKFRDFDELSAEEIQETILELKIRKRFKKLLLFVDSCQALTLGDYLNTPDTMVIGSSTKGNSAYSCNDDAEIGISLMDRMSYLMVKFFSSLNVEKARTSLGHLVASMDPVYMMTGMGVRSDKLQQPFSREKLLDWFADPTFAAGLLGKPKASPFQKNPPAFKASD